MSPPPAAPPGMQEMALSPPRASPSLGIKRCSGQGQGLPPGWDSASRSTASPAMSGTGRTLTGLSDFDEEHRVVVKNTFIDVQDSKLAALDKYSMTCTARFSAGAVQFPAITPTGAAAGSLAQLQEQQQHEHNVPAVWAPSLGSQKHGVPGPDGTPECQPCAWFYKESGCHNDEECRYCHLCPQGELKNRKKQKIQRLRAQDAATAEAMTPPPPGQAAVPPGSGKGRFPLSAHS